MKGIEVATGKRLTQVFREEVTQPVNVAVWVGPGHVQDFSAGVPNCMVVDSDDPATTDFIVDNLSSDLIRLYKGRDLIGTEVGAAAKNVIGIAAGMLDGAGYTSLKGALMARGAREIARLIRARGGNELSAASSARASSRASPLTALPKVLPPCRRWCGWVRNTRWTCPSARR